MQQAPLRRRLLRGCIAVLAAARAGAARCAVRLALFWARLCDALLPPRRAIAQGLVEYALILFLIAIVVTGAVSLLGQRTSKVYDEIACKIDGGEYHQDNGQGKSNRCKAKKTK